MDPTIRLRIATRVHFALLRHLGEDVAVGTLLNDEAYACEALWVCEASGVDELITLASQFRRATQDAARAARSPQGTAAAGPATTVSIRGANPQDMAWSQDTSGFGLTRPTDLIDVPATSTHWPSASGWLRRRAARSAS